MFLYGFDSKKESSFCKYKNNSTSLAVDFEQSTELFLSQKITFPHLLEYGSENVTLHLYNPHLTLSAKYVTFTK